MKGRLLALILFLPLPGCGVLFPYLYDAQTLHDRLAVSMTKDQVLKRLGKPDRVVQEQGAQAIWEYRLYPKGEWAAYLIHCPFFPNCYFPAEAGHPYHVVLQDDRLCLWGTPDVVHPLIDRVCGSGAAAGSREPTGRGVRISVTPLFMPPRIAPLPQRLAVVPVNGAVDSEINSWLDFTLNFLRTRHRDLLLVEREELRRLFEELGMHYGGHVDDDTAISLGRLVGADSLLIYRLIVPEDYARSAAFELRLLKIETGTTLFRQMALAQAPSIDSIARPARPSSAAPVGLRPAITKAAAYGFASLLAAFGDNPLGLVPDYKASGEGITVTDVLQGGPGFLAGLRAGDLIVASNGTPVGHWFEALPVPARLTVARNGQPLELEVR